MVSSTFASWIILTQEFRMAFHPEGHTDPAGTAGLIVKKCVAGCLFAISLFAIPLTAAAAAPTAPKDLLPNAPGKETVVRKCTQCHDASEFALQRKSGDDWDQVITQMTSNGLSLTDEEYAIVLGYLTKNLGPTPPAAKVEINKATADDLQKALQITPEEAAAITQYRTDHGPFKDWQGVAAVNGVDAKKIEAKKDVLVF
jgi:competence protein ComEA